MIIILEAHETGVSARRNGNPIICYLRYRN